MLKSVRILLAIVPYYDYKLWKMNVKMTFLYGMLTKDVHMVQPESFVGSPNAGTVCKLHSSIYGLKSITELESSVL
jgi:hypothetical protein